MTFRQKVPRNGNLASFGVGTAQGQQLNVMAASLLDQNSRSLFHKQRVRAFFSPNFFDAADPAGGYAAASRRLVSGASKDSRAGISRALFCPFRRGARLCPHSQLLRSPSKPVTTITASNPDPIPRYWTIAWFTTTQHPSEFTKISQRQ